MMKREPEALARRFIAKETQLAHQAQEVCFNLPL